MRLVLLGKPLSGKGTQAELLSQKLHIRTFSVGEILRKEIEKKTKLGKNAQKYMEKGKLVPDSIILPLVKKYLPQKGFILDGFPRDLVQAEALEKMRSIDFVIDVHCPQSLLLKRATSRRECLGCGKIYGLEFPTQKKGVCDHCQGKLVQRKDDRESTVRKRLLVYDKQTKPLIAFYKKKGLYRKVSGQKDVAFVQKQIFQILASKNKRIK